MYMYLLLSLPAYGGYLYNYNGPGHPVDFLNPQLHCLLPVYDGHGIALRSKILKSFILQLVNGSYMYQGVGPLKNTNIISTKHISLRLATSDTCLQQITFKCCRFQTNYCNCNNTTIPQCFSLSLIVP